MSKTYVVRHIRTVKQYVYTSVTCDDESQVKEILRLAYAADKCYEIIETDDIEIISEDISSFNILSVGPSQK